MTKRVPLRAIEHGLRRALAVLALQAALGDLSQTVSQALSADSPGGERRTHHQRHEIHDAREAIAHQAEITKPMVTE